jgi:hypothetical protein
MPDKTVPIATDRLDPGAVSKFGADILDMGIDHPFIGVDSIVETLLENLGTRNQMV